MGERVLKLAERRLADELFLQAPGACQTHARLLYRDTPAEARLSVRLVSWLTQNSAGHRPSPVNLEIESIDLISGQDLQTQLARRNLVYDEHSLLMRLLSHDVQEGYNNDPKSPGFVLAADGSPNLIPVGKNLAINVCRMGRQLHVSAHWDCDLGLIDDRQGKYAHLRVITIARRY